MKKILDCPHCGQDLWLEANASEQLKAADKLAEAARSYFAKKAGRLQFEEALAEYKRARKD